MTSRQKAAALKYDPQKNKAPVVTAKGKGALAEKIIQLAIDNNVPIYEDPDLAELLTCMELEAEIPVEVYEAVAQILAFIYAENEKWRKGAEGV